jgi:fermentation-respiration switch protein FrsA (DUF1100 family)
MNRKHLIRLCWAVFCASLAGCLAVENRLLYLPAPATEGTARLPSPLEDVTLLIGPEYGEISSALVKIHARWAPNPQATGAILYCPGNAGNLEQRGRVVKEMFDALGESILIFDYPGYGRSQGVPSERGCYAAAQAAYDWLVREKKIAPGRVILFGESLGGGVAVDLASRQPHRALVLVRTFTSIPDVASDQFPLLPGDMVVINRFDNLKKLPSCKQPVFIAQADQDRIIPFHHGKRLLDASGGPAEFCHLKNMGHNDPLLDDFYTALRLFLARMAPPQ